MNGTPTKCLKIVLSSLSWLRGYSVLQSRVAEFRISQCREHRARIKCLPMFLKVPSPFSSSLGVGWFKHLWPEISGLGQKLSNFCLEPTVRNIFHHYPVNTCIHVYNWNKSFWKQSLALNIMLPYDILLFFIQFSSIFKKYSWNNWWVAAPSIY